MFLCPLLCLLYLYVNSIAENKYIYTKFVKKINEIINE